MGGEPNLARYFKDLRRAFLLYTGLWLSIIAFAGTLIATALTITFAVLAIVFVFMSLFAFYYARGYVMLTKTFAPMRITSVIEFVKPIAVVNAVALAVAVADFVLEYVVRSPAVSIVAPVSMAVLVIVLYILIGHPMYRLGRAIGSRRVVVGAFLSVVPVVAVAGGLLLYSGLAKVARHGYAH